MNAIPDAIETPQQAARRLSSKPLSEGYKPVALHAYRTAEGEPIFWRIRLKHPGTGDKWIRPMYWNGTGYALGEPPAPPEGKPLYGQDRLATYPSATVYVVEGETCADTLNGLNDPRLVAVTSGGKDSAEGADWTPLKGRRMCVIWPDNDEAGMKYAESVFKVLRNVTATMFMVSLEVVRALPVKGDCVDWLVQHPDATADTVRALETFEPGHDHDDARQDDAGPRVILANAANLEPEPIRWLCPGWLARGKLHVLAGSPGTGKTTIAMDMAASISAGRPFPTGWRPEAGNVLVWSGEDDPTDTLVPRLIAAGANLSRVQFIQGVTDVDGQLRPFDPARDVSELAVAAESMDNVALIVIDPLVSAVSGDSHKNAEVRRSLAPLVDLAARLDAALLGITHFTKGSGGREPLERVTGSLAFGALARLVFGTVRMDSDNDGDSRKMMLARAKSNIGPDGGGFSYAFEQVELSRHRGVIASRIIWGAEVEGTARDLLAEPELDQDKSESGECAAWLYEELKDGERDAASMKREGARMGYSAKVLRRAREKLGIKPVKAAFNKGWVWSLPSEDAHENSKMPNKMEWAPSEQVGTYEDKTDASEAFDL